MTSRSQAPHGVLVIGRYWAASDAVQAFFADQEARLYLGARDCLRDGDAFLRIDYARDKYSTTRSFRIRPIVPDYALVATEVRLHDPHRQ